MARQYKLRIVIADDHPIFRDGLRNIIESEPGFRVVGEAGDGVSALEMIQKMRPAIAVLDISMPKLDGLKVARKLITEEPPVEVIFVTMYREQKVFTEAIQAGVKGYVLKDSAATDIISCIRAVAAGQKYASPELTTFLVNSVRDTETAGIPRSDLEGLTSAEFRVLWLLADYKTSKEIAQDLFISPRTVHTHRNNICQKLGIHGSHALMKFALAHKELLAQKLTTT
ncbi:MAG: response regulator transcription factor [Pyrinomonadaceae bacterium]|nr:response regulator transcription factor [Pyrinomonadaceae bacterium]